MTGEEQHTASLFGVSDSIRLTENVEWRYKADVGVMKLIKDLLYRSFSIGEVAEQGEGQERSWGE